MTHGEVVQLHAGAGAEEFLRSVYDPTIADAWAIARALLPTGDQAAEAVVSGYVDAWTEWSVSGDPHGPHRLVLPLVQLALREVRAGGAAEAPGRRRARAKVVAMTPRRLGERLLEEGLGVREMHRAAGPEDLRLDCLG